MKPIILLAILTISIYITAPQNSFGSCTVLGINEIDTYGPNYTLFYKDTNCYSNSGSHIKDEYLYDGSTGTGATQKSTGWILRNCYTCRNNKKSDLISVDAPCGSYRIYGCIDCTSGCTNCESDLMPQPYKEGYVRSQNRQCLNCACQVTSNYYACAPGYYGTSTDGNTGCTRCPASGNTYGTTATYGTQSITYCYIPSNTDITDDTGTYRFTSTCYYKN